MRIFCSCMISFIQCLLIYSPNIYNDGFNSMYHIHAYTNSIINVLEKIPYNNYNISIYGHYALFFILPVKGLCTIGISQMQSILIIVALTGFITFCCQYYLMSEMIKNDGVWILSVLANTAISTQIYKNGQYYQVLPHRLLFPALTLAVALYVVKYKKSRWIMWIICMLSIIWNFEIGIICCVVWFVMQYMLFARRRIDVKQLFISMSGLMCAVIVSYGIVCIYNIICGGRLLTIKQYIYPIASGVYSIEALELTLPGIYAGYFLEIVIFLSSICYMGTKFFCQKIEKFDVMICGIAIMGIGVLTYYMNRAAYCNIAIAHLEIMLLLGIICDRGIRQKLSVEFTQNPVAGVVCLLKKSTLIILVMLLLATVSSIGIILPSRLNGAWSKESLNNLVKSVTKDVPQNTFAFGYGVPELYSMLGWKCGINTIDWSDMNPDNMEYINENVKKQSCFFANVLAYEQIANKDDYECQATYDIADIQFGYYVKK